jgi:uncharacterized protein with GYD domain
MPLYMLQFAYTSEAWAALTRSPQNRTEGVSALAKSLGCRLVDVYYCFGDYDGVVLLEAPDDITATAVVLASVAPGHIKATKTTRLMTVEEGVEAMRKAGSVSYAAPPGMQAART